MAFEEPPHAAKDKAKFFHTGSNDFPVKTPHNLRDFWYPLVQEDMKQPDFDELLKAYRRSAVPALPSSFSAGILREIRLRSADAKTEPGWLPLLFGSLRPGMVAACLSLAFAVGVLAPSFARENANSMAADGLGLQVFSTSNLPSALIK